MPTQLDLNSPSAKLPCKNQGSARDYQGKYSNTPVGVQSKVISWRGKQFQVQRKHAKEGTESRVGISAAAFTAMTLIGISRCEAGKSADRSIFAYNPRKPRLKKIQGSIQDIHEGKKTKLKSLFLSFPHIQLVKAVHVLPLLPAAFIYHHPQF